MSQKPKLGQNFLTDRSASSRIVEALGDISEKTVVEIGPGNAAITELLAQKAHRLIAVELDRALAANLKRRFAGSQVEVIEQDILIFDLASLRDSDEKLLVIGNLPYYITSDILLHLFRYHNVISRAVLMMQREVADRVAAAPGSRDYGLLSATTQLYAQVEKLMTLPPGAFAPPPKVYSSVLRLTFATRFSELGVDADGFIAFLRQCFAQKRKTLVNNLRAAGFDAPGIARVVEASGISGQARAEAVSLEVMAGLYRGLTQG
ncbi:16S rRNA (adenine(1518)-N(6)/adenine(1519)-N(6))-dimethyltransferase RsmA [Alloacidobacterium sp.]|uniref:16S rRNA (adenine(1518)-N(6)/adenine(1519)-N(6))- dimethyltransferase RsmA n=1 Tax=Alloacidobacterium sp. TaxID=2951999 RepID=UPI002D23951D|nr:16S rRNA (adenine(1518)-N(6)/adenine(1519)-N(6))-dimethyltransferase RsmA [Alloacidobacterium sp.]HYK36636.1 16S rRNA (adenine(1518)-N(6)/adenine(1519)-N(6))-dimethyltransferase RsmA [Alloacidobacterium sp.]